MKLVIKNNTGVKDALNMLSEFLENNFSDYPVIKNTLNVYITLKNGNGLICPNNEKEYILSKSELLKNIQVIDVEERREEIAYKERFQEWKNYIANHKRKSAYLEKQINSDIAYIETANEKNRKEENIIKRKIQLDNNWLELKRLNKHLELINRLDRAIHEHHYTALYLKRTNRSAYKYSLDVVFIFEDIEGYTGYFDWHGLHEGVRKT